jgi:inner membrane protein
MVLSSRSPMIKVMVVAIAAIVLLIPLAMLGGLVSERTQMRHSAYEQVAGGWGGPQLAGGPVLAIPVTQTLGQNGTMVARTWYVLPESLDIRATITVQEEPRRVAIYDVPIFVASVEMSAQFDVARHLARLKREQPDAQVQIEGARLFIPVDDPRGVRDVRLIEADWVMPTLEPATGASLNGLTAQLVAQSGIETGPRSLKLSMEIAGTRSFSFLPLARSVDAHVRGNWPHPGFTRGYLPTQRTVNASGFDARWRILELNRSYGGAWFAEDAPRPTLDSSAFGVDIVQPADLYQRVERSVKYGGLFIAFTFLALFLWERLANRLVHPIQYGLIGLSLSVFYLLLLALAEQIGFAAAYGAAAVAQCALLGVYLAGAFGDRRAGTGASGSFAVMFAVLYLLVTSEDYSLLAGALVLFAMVAAAMLLTRKLDWYAKEA